MPILLKRREAANENMLQHTQPTELAQLIDQIGELEAEAVLINARIKQEQVKLDVYKKTLAKLQTYADTLEDNQIPGQGLCGTRYKVFVGDYGKKREITDMNKLKILLGDTLFMDLATVPLGKVDDYLNPIQKKEILAERKTSRKLKIIAL